MIFATFYTIGVLANILFLVVIRDAFYDRGEFMRFLYPFIKSYRRFCHFSFG